jgi:hypothetical protein
MPRRVSQPEFDLLRQAVEENSRRIDRTDKGGQGVAVLTTQLTDIKGDVAGLVVRFEQHEQEHRAEVTARRSSRRWMIVTGIAFLAMVETPLGILIAHVR